MKQSERMFEPPQRSDFDPGKLGDTRYQWAMERWQMKNHKLGPGYAASVAKDIGSGRDDSRVNPNGIEQKGTSMKVR